MEVIGVVGEEEEAAETGEEEIRPSSRERRPSLTAMMRQMKVRGESKFFDQSYENTSVQFYFYTPDFL